MEAIKPSRQFHIDNLRSFVIILVVMVHTNVTYTHIGGWYHYENSLESIDILSKVVAGFANSFNQSWFMGILFYLGGVFAARSLVAKGSRRFLVDRLVRLGLPLLAYVFIISPCISGFLLPESHLSSAAQIPGAWLAYIQSGQFLGATGPLWFVETLLVFSALLVAVRVLVKRLGNSRGSGQPGSAGASSPSVLSAVVLIFVTAIAAFSVRLFWPIDSSWLNLQFSFFASYIVLFALGVHGGATGWFERQTDRSGMRWFTVTIGMGIPLWVAIMLAAGALEGREGLIKGGLHREAAVYALWESFVAIGMALGLPVVFRRWFAGPSRWRESLAANSFSIYVFHAPVLIGLSLLLAPWAAHPLIKIAVVWPLTIVVSWAVAALLIRRIPFIKRYF